MSRPHSAVHHQPPPTDLTPPPRPAASARRAVALALSVAAAYGLVTPLPGNRQTASPDWSMS